MVHTKYHIAKFRLNESVIGRLWEYEATSTTQNYQESDNAIRGTTKRHNCIDSLAQELATFPRIMNAEFLPSPKPQRVSLANEGRTFTQ